MNQRSRGYMILGATLVIGMVVGALLVGALGQFRSGRIEGMRDDDQFVRHLERLIQPRDDAQRAIIRPLLEATSAQNRATIDEFNDRMRGALDDLLAQLEPHLDEDQQGRLQRFAERPPPGAGPGRPPRKQR
jgi:hypothetical protein